MGSRLHILYIDHEHDRIYSENIQQYGQEQGFEVTASPLSSFVDRSRLENVLADDLIGVVGYNSTLDHCWINSTPFVSLAADLGVPIIQWILDHPAARWKDFNNSAADNSAF